MGSLISRRSWLPVVLVAALALFCLASPAHAQQLSGRAAIDGLLAKFENSTGSWYYALETAARSLFWKLSLISLAVTIVSMLFRGEVRDLFAELVRFILFTGINYWLLINGPAFAQAILNTFVQLGSQVGGFGKGLSPGTVVDLGLDLFHRVASQLNWFNVGAAFLASGMALAVLVLAVLVGCNLLLLLMSAWAVAAAGIIILGFGGCRWLSDLAYNYYRAMLAIGLKILVMEMVIGIAMAYLKQAVGQINASPSVEDLAVILVVMLAMCYLSDKLPNVAASMVGNHAGQGIGNFGWGTGVAAVGTAASVAVAAATVGASTAVGAVQAVQAALQAGQDAVANGSSGTPSQNGNGQTGDTPSGNGSSGSFAGKAATFTGAAAASVPKGLASMASSRIKSAGAGSFPGKLASSIRANTAKQRPPNRP